MVFVLCSDREQSEGEGEAFSLKRPKFRIAKTDQWALSVVKFSDKCVCVIIAKKTIVLEEIDVKGNKALHEYIARHQIKVVQQLLRSGEYTCTFVARDVTMPIPAPCIIAGILAVDVNSK